MILSQLMTSLFPFSGEHEARRRWHLAVHNEELPYQDRRWRVDAFDGGRFLSQVGHQEVEGDQGALDVSLPLLTFPLSSKLR